MQRLSVELGLCSLGVEAGGGVSDVASVAPGPGKELSYLWGRENTSLEFKLPFVEFSLGQQAARQIPLQQ